MELNVIEDGLNPAVLTIAITCFVAFVVSVSILKKFLAAPRGKSSCYLNSESKPQQAFKHVLADNSYSQFKHYQLRKYKEPENSHDYSNAHPYREVISKLIKTPNLEFFEFLVDSEELSLDLGSFYTWVDTRDQLVKLAQELEKERVIAVDTEQHSLRSFLGFTALVQISTKRKDYLVDTIALHDEMGILRSVFSDPGICKVFHGADNDILWLQRDFHIYVVSLFDTAKACDVLSKPQRSLAYLLETYCNVSKNKSLQREDWRQRPLPLEMLEYAQMDTHYLLYIVRCLCMELKQCYTENQAPGDESHFLLEASRRSNASCMQLFLKDFEAFPGDVAATSLISRSMNVQGSLPSNLCDSKDCVRRLCLWRDIMARIHDEAVKFVLSDTAIIALADTVPSTEADICTIISKAELDDSLSFMPPQSPSPVVYSHLDNLLYLLQGDTVNLDHALELCLRHCLSPAGRCPLSVYNRAFLSTAGLGLGLTNRSTSMSNGFRSSKIVAKKNSRELFVQKFSCKSPVYHNCKIYANDGRLLCYCDRRKLEWYLNRNLARLVENDPPAIMLLFEPKGRPEDEDNVFYIQSKKNICVSCGEGKHYLRYRIIPSCYRMHFPEHLKSHRSHDIVLLCVDCHEVAHAAAEKYKRQIAAEFGIPLFIQRVAQLDDEQNLAELKEVGVSPLQLRTAAMALLRHGPQMPSDRREELLKIIKAYYGGRELQEGDIERAMIVGMSPHEKRKFEKKRGFAFKYFPLVQTGVDFTKTIDKNIPDLKKSSSITRVDDTREATHSSYSDKCDEMETFTPDTAGVSKQPSLLGHGPHGKKMVMHLLDEYGEDGIREFCQRWRQVFVEALHPRFLPAGWDVMHSGKREFGDFSVYNPTVKASATM